MSFQHISIIGAGNVAYHLAVQLEVAGHFIEEIWSHNIEKAEWLAGHLYNAVVLEEPNFAESNAEVFIIAVPDDAIEEVCRNIVVPQGAILAHTSGTKPIQNIRSERWQSGVIYPLQTLSISKKVDFSEIPIFIEGDNEFVNRKLTQLLGTISNRVTYLESEQRRLLHLSAVIASNFSNHLLLLAQNILEAEDVDFTVLQPLMEETISKAFLLGPNKAQTGPAVRGDEQTMQMHLSLLSNNSELSEIYQILSQSIKSNR